jgi:hypothetical protein
VHWRFEVAVSMSVHDISGTAEAFHLCRNLPQWINRRYPADSHGRYHARELDHSFNGLPSLTVEMSSAAGSPIAIYKCNITLIRGERRSWLVFSPLVVIWEHSREERGPGFGRPVIAHSVAAIVSFCEAHVRHIPDLIIASGNLTTAKAGRPFFEVLGWEIVKPSEFAAHAGDDGLVKALTFVEGQIEAAIAPLRQTGADQPDPLSFAMLRLSRQQAPAVLETPAHEASACCAASGSTV